jgi:hypothetical protein
VTTAEHRLAKVEGGLSPTALVLRWLAEAHTYDDFTPYARSLLDADPSSFPMDRLAHEAEANARQHVRGLPRNEADAVVRKAIVETIFRAQLILRINVRSHEVLGREVLVQAVLSAHLGLAIMADDDKKVAPTLKVAKIRDLLFDRVTELHATEAARVATEARYLDEAAALFPAGLRAWAAQQTASERAAVIAMRLAELDGEPPPVDEDQVAFDARVADLMADFVEPARSRAYDELGDGRRAIALAIRWLRPKLRADDAAIRGG